MASKKHKIFRGIWLAVVLIFMTWQWQSYQAKSLPNNVFETTLEVFVSEDADKISFIHRKDTSDTEIIFFQGGLVDPDAYRPLCLGLAENGFSCHIVKLRWRMPLWGYESINQLFDLGSGNYILAGHSQGGKMAAQFIHENPGQLKGLILLGTSHPRDFDLSYSTIPTLKLYAEFDGLASVDEVLENQQKLPLNAQIIFIEGGNHSQFGFMRNLLMDSSPTINREQQQMRVQEHMIDFLHTLN